MESIGRYAATAGIVLVAAATLSALTPKEADAQGRNYGAARSGQMRRQPNFNNPIIIPRNFGSNYMHRNFRHRTFFRFSICSPIFGVPYYGSIWYYNSFPYFWGRVGGAWGYIPFYGPYRGYYTGPVQEFERHESEYNKLLERDEELKPDYNQTQRQYETPVKENETPSAPKQFEFEDGYKVICKVQYDDEARIYLNTVAKAAGLENLSAYDLTSDVVAYRDKNDGYSIKLKIRLPERPAMPEDEFIQYLNKNLVESGIIHPSALENIRRIPSDYVCGQGR